MCKQWYSAILLVSFTQHIHFYAAEVEESKKTLVKLCAVLEASGFALCKIIDSYSNGSYSYEELKTPHGWFPTVVQFQNGKELKIVSNEARPGLKAGVS